MAELNRDWHKERAALHIQGKAFINGEYVPAVSGKTSPCISPINGEVLVEVASCDVADVNVAVLHARQSFESGIWSRMAPSARKKIMIRFADLIQANAVELALLETLDVGKPIRDSLNYDVINAADSIRWCGEAIDKVYGEVAATAESEIGLVTREPIGVVAIVVPWNFPLLMACWKLGPALAAGNSIILKPSEKSPLTAIRVAQLALEAGIPAGVFNVVPGLGHTVGQAMGRHMDIDTIAFTGSTRVAKQLLVYSGESNMKRVWMEAGGKSPNIVFADAPDLKAAAEGAAASIAYNQGEVCSAGSRLLVQRSIFDEFMPLLIEAMNEWKPGDPLDPETNFGAMVDRGQLETVLNYIKLGEEEGARLVSGGRQALQNTGGLFVEPTIFSGVSNAMRIAQEEIFGPVLSVIVFDEVDEAIRIANDSLYGLAAAIWTSNLSKAHRVARALKSGSVWVNQYDMGDMTAPFGGYKQSGNGRDKSLHAFHKYSELKATWIKI